MLVLGAGARGGGGYALAAGDALGGGLFLGGGGGCEGAGEEVVLGGPEAVFMEVLLSTFVSVCFRQVRIYIGKKSRKRLR